MSDHGSWGQAAPDPPRPAPPKIRWAAKRSCGHWLFGIEYPLPYIGWNIVCDQHLKPGTLEVDFLDTFIADVVDSRPLPAPRRDEALSGSAVVS